MNEPDTLLAILCTMVEQKRHNHSQAAEVSRRKAADALTRAETIGHVNRMEFHRKMADEFSQLHAEIRDVIKAW